jgi:hypothetical protein
MIPKKMGRVPAQSPQKTNVIADGAPQRQMSQQIAGDAHGHEMHPQKFVRLVGCHDSNSGKRGAARQLH